MSPPIDQDSEVWGPYASYEDVARFEYGRRMWLRPKMKARLLAHWTDPRHPYHERFAEQQGLIEAVLSSAQTPAALDLELREQGWSLRALAREIPPVFGAFFDPVRDPSTTSKAEE